MELYLLKLLLCYDLWVLQIFNFNIIKSYIVDDPLANINIIMCLDLNFIKSIETE